MYDRYLSQLGAEKNVFPPKPDGHKCIHTDRRKVGHK